MRILSIVFFTILAVLATIFVLQNNQWVEVRFLTEQIRFESPLSIWLLGCLIVGFVLSWLSAVPARWRRSREIKGYKEQIVRLEQELYQAKADNAALSAPTPPPAMGSETAVLP
ncbi:MAG: LapA family protein [Sphingobacteriales bacterium]|nr:LapA family protein [Sphingobacteriales bacterium]MCC7222998.1 LapA family protein [Chitinophagales bacterium]